MIPFKFNPLGTSLKIPSYISSFKIRGNSLRSMQITPKSTCTVDFGDGTSQTYTAGRSRNVTHSYTASGDYIIQIIGNHSNYHASQNIIEIIELSQSITDCSRMFYNCSELTNIPNSFIIGNNVTICAEMFSGCSSLSSIPADFTFGNAVTDCSYMFDGCTNLTTIEEGFALGSSVTDCSYMFRNTSLNNVPQSLTIPNSVTNCSSMFYRCTNLTTIEEGFALGSSVENCREMFTICSSLITIPSTLIIPATVTNCSIMFSQCIALISDISNIWPDFISSSRISISYMFDNCKKIVGTIPADKLWNSGKTFNATDCFRDCTLLTNYNDIPTVWK